MKPVVVRQAKSLQMSCDAVGNTLLTKFSCQDAKDACVFIPASVVFWLLEHIPVNTDPNLKAPPSRPQIEQHEWDDRVTPRVLSVQCKQFQDAVRMTFELERKPALVVLLDPSSLELMRRMLEAYRSDLINLGVD